MSEQDNSHLDGTNLENVDEEEVEIDLDEEVEEDEDLSSKLAAKEEAIRQLTARAKKAEALLKQKKPTYKSNDDLEGVKSTIQKLELAERKRQFGFDNNLSPQETDYLFKISSKPTKELLDDPFIKGGLESIRSVKRVAENTPSTSSRSPRFEVPKKENMTADDKQKAFEEYRNEKFGR